MNPPPPRPRKLGAVERLGSTSAPAPEAELKAKNLNQCRAKTRRGQFYEKASSRRSREKLALEINGEVSRDGAVALGGGANNNKKKRLRSVLMDSTIDEIYEEKGRQRTRNITMANMQRQQQKQRSTAIKKAPPARAGRSGSFKENVTVAPKRASAAPVKAAAKATVARASYQNSKSPKQQFSQTRSNGHLSGTSRSVPAHASASLSSSESSRPSKRSKNEEQEVIDLTDD